MTLGGKRELLKQVKDRYWRANRSQKHRILDEFVANTGYHRKYALALLHGRVVPHPAAQRRRRRLYTQEVTDALVKVWMVCDCIGSTRLQPYVPVIVAVLERLGEIQLSPAIRALLLSMSRATIDRLLQPARRKRVPHGRTTTKPGTLLKHSIPIRTWAQWNDAKPGFLEIDLVAHCGLSTEGDYLATLNCVDVATSWCECLVPKNRGQQAVLAALQEIRQRLPMPLLGIDSDNGGEFINEHLSRYCEQEKLTFTRSRPYQKNDQAHVESKNWTVVRRWVTYDRYNGEMARLALNALYRDVRLYVNFFQPVLKLKERVRLDGKVKKIYDAAQTPYQRVLASAEVSPDVKQKLTELYLTLNPVTLLASIERQSEHIFRTYAILPQGEQEASSKIHK